jgi:K+ transporter
MTNTVANRRHYEDAVVLGAVFSPAVLLAFPFMTSSPHQVANGIAAVLLLMVTAIGALWFRGEKTDRRSLLHWKLLLCLLLATALLVSSVAVAAAIGGHWVILGAAAALAALLAWAFHTGRLARQAKQAGANPRILGIASAAGAALGAPLLFLGGQSFMAALLASLQLLLSAISAMAALLTLSERRGSYPDDA